MYYLKLCKLETWFIDLKSSEPEPIDFDLGGLTVQSKFDRLGQKKFMSILLVIFLRTETLILLLSTILKVCLPPYEKYC